MTLSKENKLSGGIVYWLQRYGLFSYKHPFLVFFGIFALIIVFSLLFLAFGFPLYTDGEWAIKSAEQTKRSAAIKEALYELGKEVTQPKRSIDMMMLDLYFFYKAKDSSKNIFTSENLLSIKFIENSMLQMNGYSENCLLEYSNSTESFCRVPLSPLIYFFEYSTTDNLFGNWKYNGTNEDIIKAGLEEMNNSYYNTTYYFDKKFDPEVGVSEYTRSKYSFGLPTGKYTNSKIDEDDQVEDVYDAFLEDLEQNLFNILGKEIPGFLKTEYEDPGKYNNVEVVFYNGDFELYEFERVVFNDFYWALFSIISVFIFMLAHTRSVLLSIIGISEVFLAFPVSLFFYTIIFRIEYFSTLQLLIIFILLGIGADDVFVFTDAFIQSASIQNVDPSIQGRLVYTIARSSKAVFVTSFTTAVAFFCTAITSLIPMQAFGIFSGLCIVVLFIINILLMPPTLVIWAGYTYKLTNTCPCSGFLKSFLPFCCYCHTKRDSGFYLPYSDTNISNNNQNDKNVNVDSNAPEQQQGPSRLDQEMVSVDLDCIENKEISKKLDQSESSANNTVDFKNLNRVFSLADAGASKMRTIEKFFNGPYMDFIIKARYFIILIGVLLFALGIYFVSTFKTPNDIEQWFPSDHDFEKYLDYTDLQKTPYMSSNEDQYAEVYLVYGIKGMNTDNRNKWVGDDYGKIVYDNQFDMSSPEAQQHLINVCKNVRRATCNVNECNGYLVTLDRDDPDKIDEAQRCWIEEMDTWLRETKKGKFINGLPISDPMDFYSILQEYRNTSEAKINFSDLIGWSNNNELIYVMFKFDSTVKPPISSNQLKKIIDVWEDFMDGQNNMAIVNNIDGVSRGFQSGRDYWTWPDTTDALVSNAIQGLILVFVMGFVVLNIATHNIIISLLAIINIALIVAVVVGIGMKGIMDWYLGIAESITISILIGFSMDYCLHLADSYVESPHESRIERMRDSLTHLGISITAGAVTTLLASLFLWPTTLIFLVKFAFNITCTITVAYISSITFFPALCVTFGPQGEFGNWENIFNCIRNCKK